MNASIVKKARLVAVAAVVALPGLAGCVPAGPFDVQTDPNSPASARVDALVAANTGYPRWEDFPPAPTDVPTAGQIAAQVASVKADSAALEAEVAAIDWIDETAAEVDAAIRARIDETAMEPVSVERSREEIEALAESLRQRATAPPPVPRRN